MAIKLKIAIEISNLKQIDITMYTKVKIRTY